MGEGVGIALDSIRANKVRAALTILGVAIGVMVVIAMGVGDHAASTAASRRMLEAAGPKTFFVYAVLPAAASTSRTARTSCPRGGAMPWLTVEEAEMHPPAAASAT